jgi:NADP-dependent 3-hydroxy acid dehydrogenase YdfG
MWVSWKLDDQSLTALLQAGLALGSPRPFHEQTLEDIDTVIGTNISGTLYVTHAVLQKSMMLPGKHGKVVGRGTIVNISSITGLDAPPMGEATYHTSKTAMEGFSNVLRQELTGTNVRVLVVRPGFVGGATNFHGNRLSDKSAERQVFQGLQPLQETDVANAVDYLVHAPERVSIRALDVVPTGMHGRVPVA